LPLAITQLSIWHPLAGSDEPTLLNTSTLRLAVGEWPPSEEIDILFAEGMGLLAQGKPEEAVTYLQRVLDNDPTYDNGRLAPRVIKLQRRQARQFYQAAKWREEIVAWKALLRIDSEDEQALERLSIAEVNLRRAPMYERACRFTSAGNFAAARNLLKELWDISPYYGDPAGLAEKVGTHVPLPLAGRRKLLWRTLTTGSYLLVVLSVMFLFISLFSALRTGHLFSVSAVFLYLVTIVAVIVTALLRNYLDQLREKWFVLKAE
jgi:tetratricopeptide (TPR) repeat protein